MKSTNPAQRSRALYALLLTTLIALSTTHPLRAWDVFSDSLPYLYEDGGSGGFFSTDEVVKLPPFVVVAQRYREWQLWDPIVIAMNYNSRIILNGIFDFGFGFTNDFGYPPCQTLKEKALLAREANLKHQQGKEPQQIGDWKPLSDSDLSAHGINPALADSAFAVVYQNEVNGRYAVVFSGTDPTQISDWVQDMNQDRGLPADVYDAGIQLGAIVANLAGGADYAEAIGQSLGGGVSAAVAITSGMHATTYNAAGVNANTVGQHSLSEANALVNNFNVPGQALQIPQALGLAQPPAGTTRTIQNTDMAGNPVELHGIDAVLRLLPC